MGPSTRNCGAHGRRISLKRGKHVWYLKLGHLLGVRVEELWVWGFRG